MIRLPTCPICDAELPASAAADSPLFPFCSTRCKQVDLLRWCDGKYAVVDPLTIDLPFDERSDSKSDEEL